MHLTQPWLEGAGGVQGATLGSVAMSCSLAIRSSCSREEEVAESVKWMLCNQMHCASPMSESA